MYGWMDRVLLDEKKRNLHGQQMCLKYAKRASFKESLSLGSIKPGLCYDSETLSRTAWSVCFLHLRKGNDWNPLPVFRRRTSIPPPIRYWAWVATFVSMIFLDPFTGAQEGLGPPKATANQVITRPRLERYYRNPQVNPSHSKIKKKGTKNPGRGCTPGMNPCPPSYFPSLRYRH